MNDASNSDVDLASNTRRSKKAELHHLALVLSSPLLNIYDSVKQLEDICKCHLSLTFLD